MRLETVGRAQESGFDWPLTQSEIGDATALSTAHVNRVLRALHWEGIATVKARRVTVDDFGQLKAAGGFEAGYLEIKESRDVSARSAPPARSE